MNISRVLQFLQEECQIQPQSTLAVGVSGGPDSICLLDILHHSGYRVIALHLNHQIRPEAGRDAAFVEQFCRVNQIPCEVSTQDVPFFAQNNRLSIEEAARLVRYRFLFAAARRYQADALVTAHHAGDQVETILMHFIRGSGLSGLRGMSPRSILPEYDPELALVRPLLLISKEEILAYCAEKQLDYVIDATNSEETYFRNWLRHSLIPQIETRNPRFQETLLRTSRVISADVDVLNAVLLDAWHEALLTSGNGYRQMDRQMILGKLIGVKRALARKAIGELRPGLRDINFEDVERFCAFVSNPPSTGRADLVAGLELHLEDNCLTICEAGVAVPVWDYPQVDSPGQVNLPSRFELRNQLWLLAETVDRTDIDPDLWLNAPSGEAWLDLDRIQLPLTIRPRTPGDRFEMLGSQGHSSKLSDVFINHKIPQSARPAYPLVCSGDMIVWIPGIQISDAVKITGETRKLVHIRMENKS